MLTESVKAVEAMDMPSVATTLYAPVTPSS